MTMLEKPLKITQEISDDLIKRALETNQWFLSHKKIADEQIENNKKIRDDEKQPNIVRVQASHAVISGSQTMAMVSGESILLLLMAKLSANIGLALTMIDKELSELKKTATPTSRNDYDEKIKHLETNLKQLQQESDRMRPYYDAIRNAMEKMDKWREANK